LRAIHKGFAIVNGIKWSIDGVYSWCSPY